MYAIRSYYAALIARCRGAADVMHTVNFARENDLLLSIRAGGHNVSGAAIRNNFV